MGVNAGFQASTTSCHASRLSQSAVFQAYSRLLPRCVHVHGLHHFWAGVIKCDFETGECWPSTVSKDVCTFLRWVFTATCVFRNLALHGKSTEVLIAFTASLAQWWFETLFVVFEQLCKVRAFMQTDFCPEMFVTSKDNPYHIEAIARDQHFWRYVTWAHRFASMVDKHRRWGAQCS